MMLETPPIDLDSEEEYFVIYEDDSDKDSNEVHEDDPDDNSGEDHEEDSREDSDGDYEEDVNKITCLRIVVTRLPHKQTKRHKSPPPSPRFERTQHVKSRSRRRKINRNNVTMSETEDSVENCNREGLHPLPN